MLKMKTQFGDMTITDDNKTIVNDSLKKEIESNIQDDKKIELQLEDCNNQQEKL